MSIQTPPKGGEARFGVEGSFDSTNLFLGTKGTPAAAVAPIYETLFSPSLDELNIFRCLPAVGGGGALSERLCLGRVPA